MSHFSTTNFSKPIVNDPSHVPHVAYHIVVLQELFWLFPGSLTPVCPLDVPDKPHEFVVQRVPGRKAFACFSLASGPLQHCCVGFFLLLNLIGTFFPNENSFWIGGETKIFFFLVQFSFRLCVCKVRPFPSITAAVRTAPYFLSCLFPTFLRTYSDFLSPF